MIRKIFRNTLAKKLAVFAASFFIMGGGIAITAVSPPSGMDATLHVPPFDSTQVLSSYEPYALPAQFHLDGTLKALTASANISTLGLVPAVVTPPQDLSVSGAMPAAPPLTPHVDALGFFFLEQIPLSYELQRYTFDRAAALEIEYELVLALMWRESTFRIEAIGVNRNGTRDTGLMQINDVNRGWLNERYGIYNLMNPFQNIDAGTLILADLLSRYGEAQALVGYQFGEFGMLGLTRDGADIDGLSRRVREKRDEFREMRIDTFHAPQSGYEYMNLNVRSVSTLQQG
ncbi:MAG: transglycosylase SLT domain-containing protein [Oscillospiraceae bacterium]|nr:transglycosylase SLT domain-containing protein [Oscillospiraceae bacterium]